MKALKIAAIGALAAVSCVPGSIAAAPTVYPSGTTLYEPDKTDNGYTVLSPLETHAVIVIDMNGRVVKRWDGFGLSAGGPARVLPDGSVIAPEGGDSTYQESSALVRRDFVGKELWRFDRNQQIQVNGKAQWSAREHHDWQLSDFPAGYASPDVKPAQESAKILLLTHSDRRDAAIANVGIKDDRLIEIDRSGRILWQWSAADHIDAMKFDARQRAAITRSGTKDVYDWTHINSATYVGPNKWFDAGDKRFDPRNVIISSRQASFVAIVARDGSIVWQIGPDFTRTPQEKALGQIIGQHHPHLIPPGLPGAGNMLIFDNGGASGYGDDSPIAPTGLGVYVRNSSRVLEIDPITLNLVWSYEAPNFYSSHISSAQRLPNGNTLITEGADGRVFEVTPQKRIVWEYVGPPGEAGQRTNAIYRAYRIPYSWLAQRAPPAEKAIARPDPANFHVPGTPAD